MNPILDWLRRGNNVMLASGIVIVVFVFLALKLNSDAENEVLIKNLEQIEQNKAKAQELENIKNQEKPIDRLARAEKELTDINLSQLQIGLDFSIAIDEIELKSQLVSQGKASKDKAIVKAAKEFEQHLIAYQKKWFPKLRNRYIESSAEKLWEHDVYVDSWDSDNATVVFTGAYFAANKNIKQTHLQVIDMLKKLRFKKAVYKWSKHTTEIDYYDIPSLPDSQLK